MLKLRGCTEERGGEAENQNSHGWAHHRPPGAGSGDAILKLEAQLGWEKAKKLVQRSNVKNGHKSCEGQASRWLAEWERKRATEPSRWGIH